MMRHQLFRGPKAVRICTRLAGVLLAAVLPLAGCGDAPVITPSPTVLPALPDRPAELSVPLESEPPPVIKTVSFLAAGDNITYLGNVREAKKVAEQNGSEREYDFSYTYERVKPYIEAADLAFINQETMITNDGKAFKYYPTFNGPAEMAYDLIDIGFDVFNIASNHMVDNGESGLRNSIAFWKGLEHERGITMTGGYENAEDYDTIDLVEVNGITIAFLAYTEWTNGLSLPKASELIAPYFDKEIMARQVAAAKEAADLVFVSMHWGEENRSKPNALQVEYGQYLADLGVDVIIGTHPHILQPIQWLTGKDGNQTLCAYSLGNFMAEMLYDYHFVGGMLTFDIVQVDNQKPTIENIYFIPTVFEHDLNFYNNYVYLMEDYTAEQAKNHGLRTYGLSTTLTKLRSYVTNVIDAAYLPDFLQ